VLENEPTGLEHELENELEQLEVEMDVVLVLVVVFQTDDGAPQ